MAKITIDQLAVMMQKQFSSIHEDIIGVRKEIGSVRTELKEEIGSVRAELSSKIESESGSIRADIHGLKINDQNIREDINKLNDRIVFNIYLVVEENDKIKKRLTAVERKIARAC